MTPTPQPVQGFTGMIPVLQTPSGTPPTADSIAETLQSAQAGSANGTAIDMTGYKNLTIMVNGTYSGVVNFEASIDGGTTWVGCAMHSTGQITSTTLASGQTNGSGATMFNLNSDMSAYNQFRARTSSMTLGSVTVTSRKYPR